jgi:hypothetical protein
LAIRGLMERPFLNRVPDLSPEGDAAKRGACRVWSVYFTPCLQTTPDRRPKRRSRNSGK